MDDGAYLDTMWIEAERNKGNRDAPTAMICNPNGCFYELLGYDDSWLNFYIKNDFNVFLWNYRGYGNSEGSISPDI